MEQDLLIFDNNCMTVKLNIEIIKEVARSRGGQLVSKIYIILGHL